MNVYLGMQPDSYCTQCGAPMYRIFERLCPTCCCSGLVPVERYYATETTAGTEPRITYDGQCTACGGAVFHGPHGLLHSCPISGHFAEQVTTPMSALRSSEIEEITNDRAARICIMVYESIWEHQRTCDECKRYRSMGMICTEQMSLWHGLKYWEKQIVEEEEKA